MRDLLFASSALSALAIAVTMTLPIAITENIADQSPVADYNESVRPRAGLALRTFRQTNVCRHNSGCCGPCELTRLGAS
jgi:hypothetical protein